MSRQLTARRSLYFIIIWSYAAAISLFTYYATLNIDWIRENLNSSPGKVPELIAPLIIGIFGFLVPLFFLLMNRENKDYLAKNTFTPNTILAVGLVSVVAVLVWLGLGIQGIFFKERYTTYLTTSTSLIFISLVLLIGKLFSKKETRLDIGKIGDESVSQKTLFYLLFVIVIGFSFVNIICSSGQNVRQSVPDSTSPGKTDDENYRLLNMSMAWSYVITLLMGIFLLIRYTSPKAFKKMSNIFIDPFSNKFGDTGSKKEGISIGGVLAVLTGLLVAFTSVLLDISPIGGDKIGDPTSITDNQNNQILLSVGILPLSLFLLGGVSNLIFGDAFRNQPILFFLLACMILFLLILPPIFGLITYAIRKPKFYEKIENSGEKIVGLTENGEMVSTNLKPMSIFSVSGDTVNYGNGLFFLGGRSDLDLETTRGIRYVDNDTNYYNAKQFGDLREFGPIDREEDLNLFSLQTNDFAYGEGDHTTGKTYWVAVGENVGNTTGNTSSIFYNTTAGTVDPTKYVPDISTLSEWEPATNGAFDYMGNGVAAGDGVWVAVGQDQFDGSATHANVKYSTDGKAWSDSKSTGASFSDYGNKVAYRPNTGTVRFVAVGKGTNTVLTSDEHGVNWTARNPTGCNEVYDVIYGHDGSGGPMWVIVGDFSGTIKAAYSSDPATTSWTAAGTQPVFTANQGPVKCSLAYSNSKHTFYLTGGKPISGSGSGVYKSADGGATWSPVLNSSPIISDNFASDVKSLHMTGIGVNLKNEVNSSGYDDVYYPQKTYQQYFKQKQESTSLKMFLYFFYIVTFICASLVGYHIWKVGNLPAQEPVADN